jgi:hypothetical protein
MNRDYSDLAAQEQDHRAADETWCSLGEAAQRIVNQAEEPLRRNRLPHPPSFQVMIQMTAIVVRPQPPHEWEA